MLLKAFILIESTFLTGIGESGIQNLGPSPNLSMVVLTHVRLYMLSLETGTALRFIPCMHSQIILDLCAFLGAMSVQEIGVYLPKPLRSKSLWLRALESGAFKASIEALLYLIALCSRNMNVVVNLNNMGHWLLMGLSAMRQKTPCL